ncbi:MAG: hypothetical protein IJW46_00765 [Clostridia bacterium]|nr:hypothetical protein [Clostridia bacterium]
MTEENAFRYQYSAEKNKEIEAIRKKYLPQSETKLEKLKRLDRCVESAGMLSGLCIGVIGCLIFGIGMCFGLDVFAGADVFTLLFGGLGTAVMLVNYPLYRRTARRAREKYTPEILLLSEELIDDSAQGNA